MTPEKKPPDEPPEEPRSAAERLEEFRRRLEAARDGGEPEPGAVRKLVQLTIEAVREQTRAQRRRAKDPGEPDDRDRS